MPRTKASTKAVKGSPKKKKAAAATANPSSSKVADPQMAQVNYNAYKAQVTERLPPVIVEALGDLYQDACAHCEGELQDPNMTQRFKIFQRLLSEVAQWEDDEVAEETDRFMEKVPWLGKVLCQVLVSQTHIMLSMRNDRYVRDTKFTFEMPTNEEIVYHFMRVCARAVKPQARLFDHQVDELDVEANYMAIEEVVRRAVDRGISSLVPIEDIIDAQYKKAKKKQKEKNQKPKKTELKAEAEEVKMDDGVKEGDSHSQINEEEIAVLEKESAAKAVEAEKQEADAARQAAAEAAARTEEAAKLKLIPGEEHVDDPSVDELIAKMRALPRDDPKRAEYKRRIQDML